MKSQSIICNICKQCCLNSKAVISHLVHNHLTPASLMKITIEDDSEFHVVEVTNLDLDAINTQANLATTLLSGQKAEGNTLIINKDHVYTVEDTGLIVLCYYPQTNTAISLDKKDVPVLLESLHAVIAKENSIRIQKLASFTSLARKVG